MPLKLDPRDRKLLSYAGIAFVALVVVGVIVAGPSESRQDYATTYSTASTGSKAAYLLLQETGYRIQRWEQPPTSLGDGAGHMLIVADPRGFPNEAERTALNGFLNSGGRLVATGQFAGFFLPLNGAVPDFMKPADWKSMPAAVPAAITRAAPQVTMAGNMNWSSTGSATPLYADGKAAVVVKYPYGKGEVIWLADATPLTNAGLSAPGNLEFLLAIAGNKQNRMLWDEYYHGYGQGVGSSIKYTQLRWMLAQLGVIATAVLLTYSRRSGPLRPLAAESRLSPLEFVETLGGLYQRAGAGAVAVDIYYQRFRYWLTRRLGMAPNATVEELERAVRERWNYREPAIAETLRACESVRYYHDLSPREALRLVRSLHSYAAELKLFAAAKKEKA